MDRVIKAVRAGHIWNAYLVAGSHMAGVEAHGMALAREISKYPLVVRESKMEDIRDVLGKVNIRPDEGQKKVVVLYLDEMSERSQNALLKTLEEPSEYAVFILLCTNLTIPLPTIQSRCVLVHGERQTEAQIEAELQRRQVVQASLCARYAFGSLEKGMALSQDEAFWQERDRTMAYLRGYLSCRAATISKDEKDQVEKLVNNFLLFFRDCLSGSPPYFYADQTELVESYRKRFTFSQIISMIKVARRMDILLHKRTNPHLVWDSMQLGFMEVLDDHSNRRAI